MRVMLDTNILVSAILFPSPSTEKFLNTVMTHHHVFLCDYVIEELWKTVNGKFPHKAAEVERFLHDFTFERIPTPQAPEMAPLPEIRDPKDAPILAAAILEKADVLVTGDKDFLVLSISEPRIMTMAEFMTAFPA